MRITTTALNPRIFLPFCAAVTFAVLATAGDLSPIAAVPTVQ